MTLDFVYFLSQSTLTSKSFKTFVSITHFSLHLLKQIQSKPIKVNTIKSENDCKHLTTLNQQLAHTVIVSLFWQLF